MSIKVDSKEQSFPLANGCHMKMPPASSSPKELSTLLRAGSSSMVKHPGCVDSSSVSPKLSLIERFRLAQQKDLEQIRPSLISSKDKEKVQAFVDNTKTSMVLLGDHLTSIALDKTLFGKYELFYIDISRVQRPDAAVEETVKRYKLFNEWLDLKKDYSFFFIFDHCYAKIGAPLSHLYYKNDINARWMWKGKLLSLCNPNNIPGNVNSWLNVFRPLTSGGDEGIPHLFEYHYSTPLSAEEVSSYAKRHLTKQQQQTWATLFQVAGFAELVSVPFFLEAAIEILPSLSPDNIQKNLHAEMVKKWFASKTAEFEAAGDKAPENFLEKGIDLCKKLAQKMQNEGSTELVFIPNVSFEKPDPDEEISIFEHDENDFEKSVILECLPLRKKENIYSFFGSLFPYFLEAETVFTELRDVYYV